MHRHRRTTRSLARTSLSRSLRQGWLLHRQRLLTNAAYRAALAAAAAALITQHRLADLLTALVAGALAVHRALHRDPTELAQP